MCRLRHSHLSHNVGRTNSLTSCHSYTFVCGHVGKQDSVQAGRHRSCQTSRNWHVRPRQALRCSRWQVAGVPFCSPDLPRNIVNLFGLLQQYLADKQSGTNADRKQAFLSLSLDTGLFYVPFGQMLKCQRWVHSWFDVYRLTSTRDAHMGMGIICWL